MDGDVDLSTSQRRRSPASESEYSRPQGTSANPERITAAQCDTSNGYKVVIDGLTAQRLNLQAQLDSCRRTGGDILQTDELFELNVYGISTRNKRRLETILRDSAFGHGDSVEAPSSSQHSRAAKRVKLRNSDEDRYAGVADAPHTSQAGDIDQIADSTYASTAPTVQYARDSAAQIPTDSSVSSTRMGLTDGPDMPKGLQPQSLALSDRLREKIVVQRLEQLFTSALSDDQTRGSTLVIDGTISVAHIEPQVYRAADSAGGEPAREARMLHPTPMILSQLGSPQYEFLPANAHSAQKVEFGSDCRRSASRDKARHSDHSPPSKQRPPYLQELDPDRVQIPLENIAYLQHLGLVPSDSRLLEPQAKAVRKGPEGWIYLNVLTNMAQLHMINVTPSFVRSAIAKHSTAFRLSPDGRKVRWCGLGEHRSSSSDSFDEHAQRTSTKHQPSELSMAGVDLAGDKDGLLGMHELFSESNPPGDDKESVSHLPHSLQTSPCTASPDGTAPISGLKKISDSMTRDITGGRLHREEDSIHSGEMALESATTMERQQHIVVTHFASCGAGGVVAADNFQIIVTTKRSLNRLGWSRTWLGVESDEAPDPQVEATLPLAAPSAKDRTTMPIVQIDYVSGLIRHFAPSAFPRPLSDASTLVMRTDSQIASP